MPLFTGFFDNGIVQVFLLLALFAGIALLANIIRKLLWPSTTQPLKVDPKKAVKEELARVLVPLNEPLKPVDSPKGTKEKTTTHQVKTKNVPTQKRQRKSS